jgi:hypothetical protein
MFLHCLNHWKLETPTARKQQMSADELSAYKVPVSNYRYEPVPVMYRYDERQL